MVLARALTDSETEQLLSQVQGLERRLRDLSVLNLAHKPHGRTSFCKHRGACVHNCLSSLLRSFAVSYALKYSLGFFPAVLTGRAFRTPSILYRIAGRDALSFAMFMSVFISAYKGLLCALRHMRNRNDVFNPFIAGSLAGLSILLDRNKTRRVMIALYLSTRTGHFIFRWLWRIFISNTHAKLAHASTTELVENKLDFVTQNTPTDIILKKSPLMSSLTNLLAPASGLECDGQLKMDFLDKVQHPANNTSTKGFIRSTMGVLIMMVSSSQILNAYVCEPDSIAKSYLSFLITHGGVRAIQPQGSRKYLDAMSSTITAAIGNLNVNQGKFLGPSKGESYLKSLPTGFPAEPLLPYLKSISSNSHQFVCCSLQHPHTSSCLQGMFTSFNGEWWRALNMYAPLNAVIMV